MSLPVSFFRIKADDRLIRAEGVESLSEAELREDCRERGMLGNLSVEEMRQQVFLSWAIPTYFICLSNLAAEVPCKALLVVLNASYLLKKMQAAPFPDPLPHCVLKEQKKRGGGGVVV